MKNEIRTDEGIEDIMELNKKAFVPGASRKRNRHLGTLTVLEGTAERY